ncbi:ComEA family DNA-binding protein [Enhygromyxa salina]|uniref:ComE operon protein 1 n=1 Tax=Enhygromyxa salina TaxID=215803 RepID=A0A2S9YUX8_9BACT|nr:helix-hairpin-helix domain-containing protein [Enhygromyxa salina]PRQ08849.1 ComE operon protein 1 [Enhygromyxa salina]
MNKTIRTLTTSFALVLATLVGGSALAATPTNAALDTNSIVHDDARFDAAVVLEGQVNINTASAAELQLLPGIGPSIAERIVGYRETHRFEQSSNLMRVKGVGQKTYDKIKGFLTVDGETTLRVSK